MALLVYPGLRLCYASATAQASVGTYEKDGSIYASALGFKHMEECMVQVKQHQIKNSIPAISDVIIGKVIRVNQRFATVSIIVVGSQSCSEPFQGIIRVQDVRATERDKVQIYKSCRPGDIVRAKVISLGDARSYYLSTAETDLGVILAQSVAGFTMIPISWEQMICPRTKAIEYRKCAKP